MKMITCRKLKEIITGIKAMPKEIRTPEINKILSNARHDARYCVSNKSRTYIKRLY